MRIPRHAKVRRKPAVDRIHGELGSKEGLRRLVLCLAPLWKLILLGVVFTLLYSGLNLAYGWLVKEFTDALKTNGGSATLASLNQLTSWAVLVMVLKGAFYFGMQYPWSYAAQKLSMQLRNELFEHLQWMSQSYFDRRRTGQLMSAITNDVTVAVSVLDTLQDLVYAPVMLISGTVLLFFINWQLALLSLLCLPPTAWVISTAARWTRRYAQQLQISRADLLDQAEENLTGIRVVRAFSREDHEIHRFRRTSDRVFRNMMRSTRVKLIMKPAIEVIGAIAIIGVLWIGATQVATGWGNLTAGSLLWFILVLQQISSAAQDSGRIGVSLSQAGVSADRIFTILSHRSDIREKPEALELPPGPGCVEFRNVSFGYLSDLPVLDGVDFTISPGQTIAVVGPTGSGKTTIASLIPRFYDVTGGKVLVDGIDVRDCTLKSLRARMAIVPQDTILFAGTLRENIAYGRLEATDAEIEEAAVLSNAWEFIERLPDGLDTRVGERGVTLSGGQRQRVAIARAILRDPRILILDEATSSLDSHSEALVQEALGRMTRDRTTLVIAHRLSTVRNAHRILVLDHGRVVESGTHEELLSRGQVYANLYRTQFNLHDDNTLESAPEFDADAELDSESDEEGLYARG